MNVRCLSEIQALLPTEVINLSQNWLIFSVFCSASLVLKCMSLLISAEMKIHYSLGTEHKQKSGWEICFMSWLEWQAWMASEKCIFDRQYSIVSDGKIFYRIWFLALRNSWLVDTEVSAGVLYHLFHVFCRIWGLDILSCLLQNTNSTVIIHFLFLYVLCWNLGLWIASLSHSNFIYCCDQLHFLSCAAKN